MTLGRRLTWGLVVLATCWSQAASAQDTTGTTSPTATPAAPAASGPTMELAPGVVFEVVGLRR